MNYVGMDNGKGLWGYYSPDFQACTPTPTMEWFNYTKAKSKVSRIEQAVAEKILEDWWEIGEFKIILERPLVNPKFFYSTITGIRIDEAIRIMAETLQIPIDTIDSKQWQKVMLPSGLKGSAEQKKASKQKGCQLFPHLKSVFTKAGDADGMLIAKWAFDIKY